MYFFERVLSIGLGIAEPPAQFAFQLVRHAACFLFPAQCPQPPFTGLGHQFFALQFLDFHCRCDCAQAQSKSLSSGYGPMP
ncbi:hypothetical protein D3C71_1087820 [compost metagenome]